MKEYQEPEGDILQAIIAVSAMDNSERYGALVSLMNSPGWSLIKAQSAWERLHHGSYTLAERTPFELGRSAGYVEGQRAMLQFAIDDAERLKAAVDREGRE